MKILVTLLVSLLLGAGDSVSFTETVHDFGSVSTQQEILECDFPFVNTSGKTISVKYAVASCSCTRVDWTRSSIAAGGSGKISVRYSRERHANSFEKIITVYFNGVQKPVMLRITGRFFDDSSSLAKDFPYTSGALGRQEDVFNLGTAHPGQPSYKTLVFANMRQDKAMDFNLKSLSEGLEFTGITYTIEPLSRTILTCVLSPDSLSWGRRSFYAVPVVDGNKLEPLEFTALVLDDFSSLSPSQKNAGAMYRVMNEVLHFGIVKPGAKASLRINLENTTDAPLRLRSVSADRKGLSFDYPDTLPGRSKCGVQVNISPEALTPGDNRITISIVTDSPLMPYSELEVIGCVK